MRLTRLDLHAFGPFSDKTLDFSSHTPGLHIVYGANEAGKSSSLRALKALLFGFPERTNDNFIHPNTQLLLGGTIQGSDDRELAFYRRKKRKADLLDMNQDPMETGELARFFPAMESVIFESLYGIDHETLVLGGEEILAQKGDVGQALFSAGSGISSLRHILLALDAEADELFKKRGSKQQLNRAIAAYKKLQKLVKETSLPSSRWQKHNKLLQEAIQTKKSLEQEHKESDAQLQRLKRLVKVIPIVAELDTFLKQLDPLKDVVLLPDDFQKQLQKIDQEKRDHQLNQENEKERLLQLQRTKAEISLNRDILDNSVTIEDLYPRLGEYRKGQKDMDRLEGMRISHRRDASRILGHIRPDLDLDDAANLRPVLSKRKSIQSLLTRKEVLLSDETQLQKELLELTGDLKEIQEQLADLPAIQSVVSLQEAVKIAQKSGDIDLFIKEQQRETERKSQNCQAKLEQLGLWSGELTDLSSLPTPLSATIKTFEQSLAANQQEKQQLLTEQHRVDNELQTFRAELSKLERSGAILAEEDLQLARKRRDQGWQLLKRQWVAGKDVSQEAQAYDAELSLHESYEKQSQKADTIADRLRHEADRVVMAVSLRVEITKYEEKLQATLGRLLLVDEQRTTLHQKWQQLWLPLAIKALSPAEMLEWLMEIDKLRVQTEELGGKNKQINEKLSTRQQHSKRLAAELTAMGKAISDGTDELAPLIITAESVTQTELANQQKKEQLTSREKQLDTRQKKINQQQMSLQNRNETWQSDWQQLLTDLNLPLKTKPNEALDLVESIAELFTKIDSSGELSVRINGIKRDAEQFTTNVQQLLALAAPDLQHKEPDRAILRLHELLNQARSDEELLKNNQKEVESIQGKIKESKATLVLLTEKLQDLMEIAGCKHVSDLQKAMQQSTERRKLQEKISDIEAEIARAGDGLSLAEIREQAALVNMDEVPAQINVLQQKIEKEIFPGINDASEIIGEEKRIVKDMDGAATAAEAAEEMEQVAAEIERLAEQYARLRLAASLLTKEIEHYREEHQGPVIQTASRLFAQITLDSFIGLRVDINDKGDPVLIGERANGNRLEVDAMSSGTRDQLYLSLRVATLQWRLQSSEPMPFIVDDILINFDDARSMATLRMLADFSTENQVILFTHHQKVIESAKKLNKETIHIHTL